MADVADVVRPAVDQSGNLTIWWVGGTITDTAAVKAATELGAATSFRVTYDFTPDGFPFDSSHATNPDERLSLTQVLSSLGNLSYTFGDGIVYMDTPGVAGSATVVLAPVSPATSKSGYFVCRLNTPNATLAAAAQKGVVIPATLGLQRPGPLTGSGKFTRKQAAVISGPVVETTFAA